MVPDIRQTTHSAYIHMLASSVEEHVDLDMLLQVAATVQMPKGSESVLRSVRPCVSIGIAKDEAFYQYYQQ